MATAADLVPAAALITFGLYDFKPTPEFATHETNVEETNERGKSVREIGLTAARLVDLVKAIECGKVSKQKARDVFKAMLGTTDAVEKIIESLGLAQVSDDALLRSTVEAVNILNGLVTATLVVAMSSSTANGSTATRSAEGSTLIGLTGLK